ncbi:hypothetical protein [Arcobacter sp. FWKO B]|jgi:hypothetical protein|uniref:hypothetical protein n=1 Tax=Arcobacter sp. FWKO B TaxID=2593672 RepID=UPI0019036908|nr:hypothetical protein [Arcobacter sp. FWKO B]
MAYIFKDGKITTISTSDVKIPQRIVAKVDSNKESKHIIDLAIKSVKKANVRYAF